MLDGVLSKGIEISQIESFVKKLCWRDYFQLVGQTRDLNQGIEQPQQPILNHEI